MIEVSENVLEGTWEEITEEGERFTGKRVRVIVLPERNETAVQPPPYPGGSLAEAMEGLIGVIHCEPKGGIPASLDETSFSEYLEQKRREGRL